MATPTIQSNFRVRKSFSKIPKVIDIPNLIEIQKRSFKEFLQADVEPDKREVKGLQYVFKDVFPFNSYDGLSQLDFVSYALDKPKYDLDECVQRGMTYSAPLKVTLRLVVWDKDEESDVKEMRDVKEQEVYLGEIPLMTQNGTFIINGTERVIVSQLHRSPGIFFDNDKGKTHSSGKLLFNARLIPSRGSWLDFEFDPKDILHVRIDRRRKAPATVLLRALGAVDDTSKKNSMDFKGTVEEILRYFYKLDTIYLEADGQSFKSTGNIDEQVASADVLDGAGNVIVKKGSKIRIRRLEKYGITRVPIDVEELMTKISAEDIIDDATGEVLLECNEELSEERVEELRRHGYRELKVLFIDNRTVGPWLRETLLGDKMNTPEDALFDIFKRVRPGEVPNLENAKTTLRNMFFTQGRYDLSKVGRLKLNAKLGIDEPVAQSVLTKRDLLEVIRYMLDLKDGRGSATIDDIDHLGNRRVRAVGELLEQQFRVGLIRMDRMVKERMTSGDTSNAMPHDLVNPKNVSSAVKEFFAGSQLSQFMDQNNPLSEITHKRRLSALGPGGLTRERAGFEVRDVHTSHYGRICPIESPEGQNIGLISSLSSYAQVNEYGFIETPYRTVRDGQVTDEVKYYSALDEGDNVIAQANAPLDDERRFTNPPEVADDEDDDGESAEFTSMDEDDLGAYAAGFDDGLGSFDDGLDGDQKKTNVLVTARRHGETESVDASEVTLMDVSPNQLVSVAASLIPFLENDDANRALMGSNMQRQAVPLLRTAAPLVGTGFEHIVARDSGVCVVARRDGVVESVDASRIVVKADYTPNDLTSPADIYNLTKYRRSNQNTCINQKPIVKKGDRVKVGDILADGPAIETGDLALGKNIVVAFTPWQGYNFEDSILINERLVREDVFTSIHIEEFECVARDGKLGKEEITRDIPNQSPEALANLDESGIVRIGADVRPGDILVGKVTPKSESQQSPEEKLLYAIFGHKADDVRDSSKRVDAGIYGTVINVKVFSRKGVDKDDRAKEIEEVEEKKLRSDMDTEVQILRRSAYDRVKEMLRGKEIGGRLSDSESNKTLIKRGEVLSDEVLDAVPYRYWIDIQLLKKDAEVMDNCRKIIESFEEQKRAIEMVYEEKISRLKRGDELQAGVLKMVKVYVAIKRKLCAGDKMAGRHGNKGVVSRILPEEDMPYMADGRPVDMVLNPLGVPSRMNIGQILETHLGWAARSLGEQLNSYVELHYSPDALRKELKTIYPNEEFGAFIDRVSDEDVVGLCKKLKTGIHVATPVFDGAQETEIDDLMAQAHQNVSGQQTLFDGRTGEPFDQDVTVGVMYMLKLHHLVDEKMHARAIGPYSLVTQQPLGGKAQRGGQRLGEMEVWAMEAYGAAYSLQEFLTVKSDDVFGRSKMYENIVKGKNILESGVPESFNVLVKELQSLGMDISLLESVSDNGPGAKS